MARLTNDATGVVVTTSDENAERLPAGWSAESKSGSKSTARKSASSKSDDKS